MLVIDINFLLFSPDFASVVLAFRICILFLFFYLFSCDGEKVQTNIFTLARTGARRCSFGGCREFFFFVHILLVFFLYRWRRHGVKHSLDFWTEPRWAHLRNFGWKILTFPAFWHWIMCLASKNVHAPTLAGRSLIASTKTIKCVALIITLIHYSSFLHIILL